MENREKYTPAHIANYFLWRAWEEGVKDMTQMKLIKLVYIAYGWYLVLNKDNERKKLFEENIEAWRYGPVIPSIYHEFKHFGENPIKKGCYMTVLDNAPIVRYEDAGVLRILNAEWEQYKDKNGTDLSNITHEPNGAWYKAYGKGVNAILDDEDIKNRAIDGIKNFLEKSKN